MVKISCGVENENEARKGIWKKIIVYLSDDVCDLVFDEEAHSHHGIANTVCVCVCVEG